jgi:hypothetical protein
MNVGVKEPVFEADPGAFRRDNCRHLCTGEHVKELVCFTPAPLPAQLGVVSHREMFLLKGESPCKWSMNAVVAWMSI